MPHSSNRRWSDAELQAAAGAVHKHIETGLARLPAGELNPHGVAAAVLGAVLPLHAARVRAETADGIADELHEQAGREPDGSVDQVVMLHASAIARAHRTTPTEEPTDA